MKRIKFKPIIAITIVTLLLGSCSKDILEEQPRTFFEPGFFTTASGVEGGLTGMYAHLRTIFGSHGFYNGMETGTDEYTWGDSGAGSGHQVYDYSGFGLVTPNNSDAGVFWNEGFRNINTASGVIENATAVGTIPESLISEARFFRAFDYFYLVQLFGGVPLDLGAGELKFNTSQSRSSVRNTVPEVYTRAIFPDLITAIEELPATPRLIGTATKTVARFYLAKAYLTYGWWLENPHNVPTYPEAARVDPDGRDANWYYQQAYNVAMEAINDPGPYGLLDYYYDVHRGGNVRNKECLLFADHTETDPIYNGSHTTDEWAGNQYGHNNAYFLVTHNYTDLRSSRVTPFDNGNRENSVRRITLQGYGRPWVRMAPPHEVFTETFAEKAIDSRYDGTFQTTFRGNWNLAGVSNAQLYNANSLPVVPGDVILSFLDEEPIGTVDYSNTYDGGKLLGKLPGRADYVLPPSKFSRLTYPNLWKISTYRTDNAGGLGFFNLATTTPFVIAKFSELYLIAAEAAVKGATGTMTARQLVNVLRERAGKWYYDNNAQQARVEDNSAAMVAATPAVVDINYILMERSRELFGESMRRLDLVRTQKWEELAGSYTINPSNSQSTITVTRTIKKTDYLFPIPQGQIDAMDASPEEKLAYQTPWYNQ